LRRHELPISDSELVEIAVDLPGPARCHDDRGETVTDLIDDVFELHDSFEGGNCEPSDYPTRP
jgi:hypothetical protein